MHLCHVMRVVLVQMGPARDTWKRVTSDASRFPWFWSGNVVLNSSFCRYVFVLSLWSSVVVFRDVFVTFVAGCWQHYG